MALELTDDERQLLASLPQTIGAAMAFAGKSGFFGTGKELFASGKTVLEGGRQYAGNALIQSLIPDVQAADRGAEMARMTATRDWARARMKEKGIDSPAKLRELAVTDARAASALLAARVSPEVADEYRAWTMQVAENVANAASEGGFLGFGGERLSEGERQLLDDLKTALAPMAGGSVGTA